MLRHNCSILSALPLRYIGGDPGTLSTMWRRGDRINQHAGQGIDDKTAGVPNGHLAPSSWVLPMKAGGMSAYVGTSTSLQLADLLMAAGRNVDGSASITITLADAPLQLIVSAEGTATFVLSADATLAGALSAAGTATIELSVPSALLGAVVDGAGVAELALAAVGTMAAIGHMAGTTEVTDELSPASLAAAVGARIVEAGFTQDQILRLLAAHAAGAATGLEGGNPQFVGLDGSTVRIDGSYSAGTRTIDALNGD